MDLWDMTGPDLPSPSLSRVSQFHDLSHTVTSWELISHPFSENLTPENFGVVGFVSKLDIKR